MIGLAGILAVAALLSAWNIGSVGLSPNYASAAKSMAADPRALLFGTVDPAATLTLDKLSGFVLPQALAVALLGFHPWVLALPEVLEGLVTVAAGFVIGSRWRGTGAGLAIAGVLATTPMLAAMFGRPTEDGLVTMCQVLAFAALQRWLQRQRLGWLVLSGAWVAVGFQAKMMQSWLFLPVLVVTALVGGRAPLRTRVLHIAVACTVCVLASIAWMTAIQLVPPGSRPFIDGTTDDDVFSMVFGYDGVDRLLHGLVPGAVPQLNASVGAGHPVLNRTRTGSAAGSIVKAVLPQFTTQIGWLYPAAAAGIGCTAVDVVRRWSRHRAARPARHPGADEARIGIATELGLAVWLLTTVPVLSLAFVPHATYFAVVALPIAVFAVHGAARSIRAYRSNRRWAALPALVGAQTAWAASVVASTAVQLRPLLVGVLVVGALSVGALVITRSRRAHAVQTLGIAAGLVVGLVGPITWSSFVVGSGGGGSASDAFAGPPIGAPTGLPLIGTGHRPALIVVHRPFSGAAGPHLSPADRTLLRYVDARNRARTIPFASDSLPVVESIILGSGASPLPMGGFSGRAPEPAFDTLLGLVRTGRLRFVLLQRPAPDASSPADPVLDADRSWVRRRCSVALSGRFHDRSAQRQDLYDCGSAFTPER